MKRQTPEEMRAILNAFATAHNAARQDPFRYEREETERLARLCRANYDGTVEQPEETTPGTHWFRGVGWFHREPGTAPPDMIAAVARLCGALAAVEHGAEEADRLLNAKHVGLLLERAQRACGVETLEETAARLTERQRECVLSLWAMRAFEQDAGVNIPQILERMPKSPDEKHVGDIVRAFVVDGTVQGDGYGRYRIHWLSSRGRALGEHLHYVYGTPL